MKLAELRIAIIGLGSVGLQLAVEFGEKAPVVGFDIHQKRIDEFKSGKDHTLKLSLQELYQAVKLTCTAELSDLKDSNFLL